MSLDTSWFEYQDIWLTTNMSMCSPPHNTNTKQIKLEGNYPSSLVGFSSDCAREDHLLPIHFLIQFQHFFPCPRSKGTFFQSPYTASEQDHIFVHVIGPFHWGHVQSLLGIICLVRI
jgi:hypothetical protein